MQVSPEAVIAAKKLASLAGIEIPAQWKDAERRLAAQRAAVETREREEAEAKLADEAKRFAIAFHAHAESIKDVAKTRAAERQIDDAIAALPEPNQNLPMPHGRRAPGSAKLLSEVWTHEHGTNRAAWPRELVELAEKYRALVLQRDAARAASGNARNELQRHENDYPALAELREGKL